MRPETPWGEHGTPSARGERGDVATVPSLPTAALVAATLAGVWVLGLAGVHFAPDGSQVSIWWPAAGLAVALLAVARGPQRPYVAVAVVVGSIAASLADGRMLTVAVGLGVADTLEAVLCVWWLTGRGRPHPRLASLEDLTRLLFAAVLAAGLAGLVSAGTVALLEGADPWSSWRAALAAHAVAIVVIAPLALTLPPDPRTATAAETALQSAALLVVSWAVFSPSQELPVTFLPMPVLMWGAVRLAPRWVCAELLVAGTVTSMLTTAGFGPFAAAVAARGTDPELVGTLLQANLLGFALLTLPLVLTVHQRRVAVEEAIASHDLLDSVLAGATATAIIGTDRDGAITFFNEGGENLLGYRAEEVVGRAGLEHLHDDAEVAARAEELGVEPGFAVFTARLEAGEDSELRDWTFVCRNGNRITVSERVTRRLSADGEVLGYLSVAEDVSDRRRAEGVLRDALAREREALERMEHLDHAKTEFVSSISHELRTPLTSVLGYTDMLLKASGERLTDRQRALLEPVGRNGRRLLGLIEDLLTLSRIEAGTFEVHRRPVPLKRVVDEAVESVMPLLHGRELQVDVETDPGAVVLGDPAHLERVVLNLMTNAVKFTPDNGRIQVRLRTRGGHAEIVVADTGIGVSAAEQPRLFERFFRTAASRDLAIQGTGLGLSIVDTIVAAHDGTIGVESQPGKGTTFLVRLPLYGDPQVPSSERTRDSSSSARKGLTR